MNDGNQPQVGVPLNWLGRVFNLTGDGQICEAKLVCIAQFAQGPREVAEMTIRVYEGGLELLRNTSRMAADLAEKLATQQLSGLVVPKV